MNINSKIRRHFLVTSRKHIAIFVFLSCFGLHIPSAWATTPDSGLPDASTPPPDNAAAKSNKLQVNAALAQQFDQPDAPKVGDRLTLTLDITHPPNTTVHLPEAFPNPRWELTNREHKSTPGEDKISTTIELVFQIFRPGATTLPGFDVTILRTDGTFGKLKTQPVDAKILSVLPADKTPSLTAPRDPVAVWTDDYTPLWVGGTLLALLLVSGVSVFISRRNRPEPPGPPPRPAHLVALEKLNTLSPGDLLDRGEYMLFYVRMSEAIREYLGRRYGFRGTELTTTEILNNLNAVEDGEGWPAGISYSDVRDWLNYCDLIKFSDLTPERERSEQLLRQAFSTVELTHIRAPKPDANDAPDAKDAPSPSTATSTAQSAQPSDDAQPSESAPDSPPKPLDSAQKTDTREKEL